MQQGCGSAGKAAGIPVQVRSGGEFSGMRQGVLLEGH